jgi:hypothetical protein
MQATLRTVFEQDPTERRQAGRWKLCTHGREILAERQVQHFVHIRAGLRGEHALVQRLRGHGRLRMALAEQITESVQGHRGICEHVGRHACDESGPRQHAGRPLDKTGLTGQRLQLVVVKHAREFPFDLGSKVRTLALQRHGDVLFLRMGQCVGGSCAWMSP